MQGQPQRSLHHPVPCLLDEADDEFAHFDRLIHLEGDDLLPTSEGGVRTAPGPPARPRAHSPSPTGHSHPGSCPAVWDLC